MAESATATQSSTGGPSLEAILWANAERCAESPSLVDRDMLAEREQFVDRIARSLDGDLPAEEFVAHFFGEDSVGIGEGSSDLAEAVVRATQTRMHVYSFNLDHFEYVVLEEEDKLVVVSDFGQFAVQSDDGSRAAIESAVVPSLDSAQREGARGQRAYMVRRDGTMEAMDVPTLARVLDKLVMKQVAAPAAISDPGSRLWAFDPIRTSIDLNREVELVRQERRLQKRKALPEAPPLLAAGTEALQPLFKGKGAASDAVDSPPQGADAAVLVLLPDGTFAQPAIGSATRWRDLVSDWVIRASALTLGQSRSMPVGGGGQFTVDSGKVVALFGGNRQQAQLGGGEAGPAWPGMLGQRAQARSEGISLSRGGGASIRVLGDDELALAVSRGAVLVPGWMAIGEDGAGNVGDRYWIQPEGVFEATVDDKKELARGVLRLDDDQPQLVATRGLEQPPQLGSITGDPWADWALTTGGSVEPETLLLASSGRDKALSRSSRPSLLLAAMARADAEGSEVLVGPHGRELRLPGGQPAVAFRAPDGTLITQRQVPTLRLAEIDRPDGSDFEFGYSDDDAQPRLRIGARSGTLPASVLASLSLALERSASAGGFHLPPIRIGAAADAIEAGQALELTESDPRRRSAMLMGSPSFSSGASGDVGRLVLSLPFPSRGEVNVGPDLSEALQAFLAAPVVPAQPARSAASFDASAPAFSSAAEPTFSVAGRVLPVSAQAGTPVAVRVARQRARAEAWSIDLGQDIDLSGAHAEAHRSALSARQSLSLPDVAPLLSRSPSLASMPRLLSRALQYSGEWMPGPGAPMPAAISRFATRPQAAELVYTPVEAPDERDQRRPLSLGEDEIVIPMPLWAQMGRGRLSATSQIMAPRGAPLGHAPPLGSYRLIAPAGAPYDFTAGAPASAQVARLAGPTALDLVAEASGPISAQKRGGQFALASVPVADPEGQLRRIRLRVGAPLGADELASLGGQSGAGAGELGQDAPSGELVVAEQRQQQKTPARASNDEEADQPEERARKVESETRARRQDSARDAETAERDSARQQETTQRSRTQQARETDQARETEQAQQVRQTEQAQKARQAEAARQEDAERTQPSKPEARRAEASDKADQPSSGEPRLGDSDGAPGAVRSRIGSLFDEGDRPPMTSALEGALRTSDDVAGRLQPIPDAGTGATLGAAKQAPAMVVAAPQAPEARHAPTPAPSSDEPAAPASQPPSRSASSSQRTSPSTPSAGSDSSRPSVRQVSSPASSQSRTASPATSSTSAGSDAAVTGAPPTSSSRQGGSSRGVLAGSNYDPSDAARASSSAASSAGRRSRAWGDEAYYGLPPGTWSGSRRGELGHTAWSYSPRASSTVSYGGISLSGLSRPQYPSLPSSLRFRYVAAPLWWSSTSRGESTSPADSDSSSESSSRSAGFAPGAPGSSAHRALRAGVRAANSAATLWRTILVRAPGGGSRVQDGYEDEDGEAPSDAGAMDHNWDTSALQLSSLASRFDAFGSATLVAPSGSGEPSRPAPQPNGAGALASSAGAEAATRAFGNGPQSVYVAFDRAGRAGTLDPKASVLREAQSNLDMSIVAAIPPQPPSMEQMSSQAQAYTRRSGHAGGAAAHPAGGAPEAEAASSGGGGDAVPIPASKIEGSVDAIAQRIYHRIRRRIASDRERFGG